MKRAKQVRCRGAMDPEVADCEGAGQLTTRGVHVSGHAAETTLELIRHIGMVYATGDSSGWDACLALGERRHGPCLGAALAARVTALMRAVREERNGRFNFMMPGCGHICPDEVALLAVIDGARGTDYRRLRAAALAFACTRECPKLERAARSLLALHLEIERAEALYAGPSQDAAGSPPSLN